MVEVLIQELAIPCNNTIVTNSKFMHNDQVTLAIKISAISN